MKANIVPIDQTILDIQYMVNRGLEVILIRKSYLREYVDQFTTDRLDSCEEMDYIFKDEEWEYLKDNSDARLTVTGIL